MEATIVDVPINESGCEEELKTEADIENSVMDDSAFVTNNSPHSDDISMDKNCSDYSHNMQQTSQSYMEDLSSEQADEMKNVQKNVADDKNDLKELRATETEVKKNLLNTISSIQKHKSVDSEDDSLHEFERRKTRQLKEKSEEESSSKILEKENKLVTKVVNETDSPINQMQSSLSVLESISRSINDIEHDLDQIRFDVVAKQADEIVTNYTVATVESLLEPVIEIKKHLTFIEKQLADQKDKNMGKITEEILQTLSKPVVEFQQSLLDMGYSEARENDELFAETSQSILDAVTPPLKDINRELNIIEEDLLKHAAAHSELEKFKQASVSFDSDSQKMIIILEEYSKELGDLSVLIHHKICNTESNQPLQKVYKKVNLVIDQMIMIQDWSSNLHKCIEQDMEQFSSFHKDLQEFNCCLIHYLDTNIHVIQTVLQTNISPITLDKFLNETLPLQEKLATSLRVTENLSPIIAANYLCEALRNYTSSITENINKCETQLCSPLVRNIESLKSMDDSIDIIINSLDTIEKCSEEENSYHKKRLLMLLTKLQTPLQLCQTQLHIIERRFSDQNTRLDGEEVYNIMRNISEPLQMLRKEISLLVGNYQEMQDLPEEVSQIIELLAPNLKNLQDNISTFHEIIFNQQAEEIDEFYILSALNNFSPHLCELSNRFLEVEDVILEQTPIVSDPKLGIRIVMQSVSNLVEVVADLQTSSEENHSTKLILCNLSEPLVEVKVCLKTINDCFYNENLEKINITMLKTLSQPFNLLQKRLIEATGVVTGDLKHAVTDLQRTILTIQDQVSFEYGDQPASIEYNIMTLQTLIKPMNVLRRHCLILKNPRSEQDSENFETAIDQLIEEQFKTIDQIKKVLTQIVVSHKYLQSQVVLSKSLHSTCNMLNSYKNLLLMIKNAISKDELSDDLISHQIKITLNQLYSDFKEIEKSSHALSDILLQLQIVIKYLRSIENKHSQDISTFLSGLKTLKFITPVFEDLLEIANSMAESDFQEEDSVKCFIALLQSLNTVRTLQENVRNFQSSSNTDSVQVPMLLSFLNSCERLEVKISDLLFIIENFSDRKIILDPQFYQRAIDAFSTLNSQLIHLNKCLIDQSMSDDEQKEIPFESSINLFNALYATVATDDQNPSLKQIQLIVKEGILNELTRLKGDILFNMSLIQTDDEMSYNESDILEENLDTANPDLLCVCTRSIWDEIKKCDKFFDRMNKLPFDQRSKYLNNISCSLESLFNIINFVNRNIPFDSSPEHASIIALHKPVLQILQQIRHVKTAIETNKNDLILDSKSQTDESKILLSSNDLNQSFKYLKQLMIPISGGVGSSRRAIYKMESNDEPESDDLIGSFGSDSSSTDTFDIITKKEKLDLVGIDHNNSTQDIPTFSETSSLASDIFLENKPKPITFENPTVNIIDVSGKKIPLNLQDSTSSENDDSGQEFSYSGENEVITARSNFPQQTRIVPESICDLSEIRDGLEYESEDDGVTEIAQTNILDEDDLADTYEFEKLVEKLLNEDETVNEFSALCHESEPVCSQIEVDSPNQINSTFLEQTDQRTPNFKSESNTDGSYKIISENDSSLEKEESQRIKPKIVAMEKSDTDVEVPNTNESRNVKMMKSEIESEVHSILENDSKLPCNSLNKQEMVGLEDTGIGNDETAEDETEKLQSVIGQGVMIEEKGIENLATAKVDIQLDTSQHNPQTITCATPVISEVESKNLNLMDNFSFENNNLECEMRQSATDISAQVDENIDDVELVSSSLDMHKTQNEPEIYAENSTSFLMNAHEVGPVESQQIFHDSNASSPKQEDTKKKSENIQDSKEGSLEVPQENPIKNICDFISTEKIENSNIVVESNPEFIEQVNTDASDTKLLAKELPLEPSVVEFNETEGQLQKGVSTQIEKSESNIEEGAKEVLLEVNTVKFNKVEGELQKAVAIEIEKSESNIDDGADETPLEVSKVKCIEVEKELQKAVSMQMEKSESNVEDEVTEVSTRVQTLFTEKLEDNLALEMLEEKFAAETAAVIPDSQMDKDETICTIGDAVPKVSEMILDSINDVNEIVTTTQSTNSIKGELIQKETITDSLDNLISPTEIAEEILTTEVQSSLVPHELFQESAVELEEKCILIGHDADSLKKEEDQLSDEKPGIICPKNQFHIEQDVKEKGSVVKKPDIIASNDENVVYSEEINSDNKNEDKIESDMRDTGTKNDNLVILKDEQNTDEQASVLIECKLGKEIVAFQENREIGEAAVVKLENIIDSSSVSLTECLKNPNIRLEEPLLPKSESTNFAQTDNLEILCHTVVEGTITKTSDDSPIVSHENETISKENEQLSDKIELSVSRQGLKENEEVTSIEKNKNDLTHKEEDVNESSLVEQNVPKNNSSNNTSLEVLHLDESTPIKITDKTISEESPEVLAPVVNQVHVDLVENVIESVRDRNSDELGRKTEALIASEKASSVAQEESQQENWNLDCNLEMVQSSNQEDLISAAKGSIFQLELDIKQEDGDSEEKDHTPMLQEIKEINEITSLIEDNLNDQTSQSSLGHESEQNLQEIEQNIIPISTLLNTAKNIEQFEHSQKSGVLLEQVTNPECSYEKSRNEATICTEDHSSESIPDLQLEDATEILVKKEQVSDFRIDLIASANIPENEIETQAMLIESTEVANSYAYTGEKLEQSEILDSSSFSHDQFNNFNPELPSATTDETNLVKKDDTDTEFQNKEPFMEEIQMSSTECENSTVQLTSCSKDMECEPCTAQSADSVTTGIDSEDLSEVYWDSKDSDCVSECSKNHIHRGLKYMLSESVSEQESFETALDDLESRSCEEISECETLSVANEDTGICKSEINEDIEDFVSNFENEQSGTELVTSALDENLLEIQNFITKVEKRIMSSAEISSGNSSEEEKRERHIDEDERAELAKIGEILSVLADRSINEYSEPTPVSSEASNEITIAETKTSQILSIPETLTISLQLSTEVKTDEVIQEIPSILDEIPNELTITYSHQPVVNQDSVAAVHLAEEKNVQFLQKEETSERLPSEKVSEEISEIINENIIDIKEDTHEGVWKPNVNEYEEISTVLTRDELDMTNLLEPNKNDESILNDTVISNFIDKTEIEETKHIDSIGSTQSDFVKKSEDAITTTEDIPLSKEMKVIQRAESEENNITHKLLPHNDETIKELVPVTLSDESEESQEKICAEETDLEAKQRSDENAQKNVSNAEDYIDQTNTSDELSKNKVIEEDNGDDSRQQDSTSSMEKSPGLPEIDKIVPTVETDNEVHTIDNKDESTEENILDENLKQRKPNESEEQLQMKESREASEFTQSTGNEEITKDDSLMTHQEDETTDQFDESKKEQQLSQLKNQAEHLSQLEIQAECFEKTLVCSNESVSLSETSIQNLENENECTIAIVNEERIVNFESNNTALEDTTQPEEICEEQSILAEFDISPSPAIESETVDQIQILKDEDIHKSSEIKDTVGIEDENKIIDLGTDTLDVNNENFPTEENSDNSSSYGIKEEFTKNDICDEEIHSNSVTDNNLKTSINSKEDNQLEEDHEEKHQLQRVSLKQPEKLVELDDNNSVSPSEEKEINSLHNVEVKNEFLVCANEINFIDNSSFTLPGPICSIKEDDNCLTEIVEANLHTQEPISECFEEVKCNKIVSVHREPLYLNSIEETEPNNNSEVGYNLENSNTSVSETNSNLLIPEQSEEQIPEKSLFNLQEILESLEKNVLENNENEFLQKNIMSEVEIGEKISQETNNEIFGEKVQKSGSVEKIMSTEFKENNKDQLEQQIQTQDINLDLEEMKKAEKLTEEQNSEIKSSGIQVMPDSSDGLGIKSAENTTLVTDKDKTLDEPETIDTLSDNIKNKEKIEETIKTSVSEDMTEYNQEINLEKKTSDQLENLSEIFDSEVEISKKCATVQPSIEESKMENTVEWRNEKLPENNVKIESSEDRDIIQNSDGQQKVENVEPNETEDEDDSENRTIKENYDMTKKDNSQLISDTCEVDTSQDVEYNLKIQMVRVENKPECMEKVSEMNESDEMKIETIKPEILQIPCSKELDESDSPVEKSRNEIENEEEYIAAQTKTGVEKLVEAQQKIDVINVHEIKDGNDFENQKQVDEIKEQNAQNDFKINYTDELEKQEENSNLLSSLSEEISSKIEMGESCVNIEESKQTYSAEEVEVLETKFLNSEKDIKESIEPNYSNDTSDAAKFETVLKDTVEIKAQNEENKIKEVKIQSRDSSDQRPIDEEQGLEESDSIKISEKKESMLSLRDKQEEKKGNPISNIQQSTVAEEKIDFAPVQLENILLKPEETFSIKPSTHKDEKEEQSFKSTSVNILQNPNSDETKLTMPEIVEKSDASEKLKESKNENKVTKKSESSENMTNSSKDEPIKPKRKSKGEKKVKKSEEELEKTKDAEKVDIAKPIEDLKVKLTETIPTEKEKNQSSEQDTQIEPEEMKKTENQFMSENKSEKAPEKLQKNVSNEEDSKEIETDKYKKIDENVDKILLHEKISADDSEKQNEKLENRPSVGEVQPVVEQQEVLKKNLEVKDGVTTVQADEKSTNQTDDDKIDYLRSNSLNDVPNAKDEMAPKPNYDVDNVKVQTEDIKDQKETVDNLETDTEKYQKLTEQLGASSSRNEKKVESDNEVCRKPKDSHATQASDKSRNNSIQDENKICETPSRKSSVKKKSKEKGSLKTTTSRKRSKETIESTENKESKESLVVKISKASKAECLFPDDGNVSVYQTEPVSSSTSSTTEAASTNKFSCVNYSTEVCKSETPIEEIDRNKTNDNITEIFKKPSSSDTEENSNIDCRREKHETLIPSPQHSIKLRTKSETPEREMFNSNYLPSPCYHILTQNLSGRIQIPLPEDNFSTERTKLKPFPIFHDEHQDYSIKIATKDLLVKHRQYRSLTPIRMPYKDEYLSHKKEWKHLGPSDYLTMSRSHSRDVSPCRSRDSSHYVAKSRMSEWNQCKSSAPSYADNLGSFYRCSSEAPRDQWVVSTRCAGDLKIHDRCEYYNVKVSFIIFV